MMKTIGVDLKAETGRPADHDIAAADVALARHAAERRLALTNRRELTLFVPTVGCDVFSILYDTAPVDA